LVHALDSFGGSPRKIILVHPTNAYLFIWRPRILSLRNSGSLNP
jgi:hypothetical protein